MDFRWETLWRADGSGVVRREAVAALTSKQQPAQPGNLSFPPNLLPQLRTPDEGVRASWKFPTDRNET